MASKDYGDKEIGTRIRKKRIEKGISMEELAEKIGIDYSALSKIEKGTRAIQAYQAIALANTLEISCDYLLRGIETENVDFCTRTGLNQESVEALEKMISPLNELDNLINIRKKECKEYIEQHKDENFSDIEDSMYEDAENACYEEKGSSALLAWMKYHIVNSMICDGNFFDKIADAAFLSLHSFKPYSFLKFANKEAGLYKGELAFSDFFESFLKEREKCFNPTYEYFEIKDSEINKNSEKEISRDSNLHDEFLRSLISGVKEEIHNAPQD